MTVYDLLTQTLPKLQPETLTGTTIYQATDTITDMLFAALLNRQSDIVRRTNQIWFAPDERESVLPAGFQGLSAHPEREDGRSLGHVSSENRGYYQTLEAGQQPEAYELEGRLLRIFPACKDGCKLTLRFWHKQPKVKYLAEPLPFAGLFDDVYRDLAPGVLAGVEDNIREMVAARIDAVLTHRKGGRRRTRSLYY